MVQGLVSWFTPSSCSCRGEKFSLGPSLCWQGGAVSGMKAYIIYQYHFETSETIAMLLNILGRNIGSY